MKRQNSLDCSPGAVVQLERDSRLRFLLAALEFQPELHEKEFVENHTDVGGRTEGLQLLQAFAGLRPVNVPKGSSRRYQPQV